MTSPALSSRLPAEPELSGLRAFALLIVVSGHFVQRVDRFNPQATPEGRSMVLEAFAAPAAGVYLFFAISGYLIARALAAERPWGGRHVPLRFLARRVVRIAPPYCIVLLVTFLLVAAAGLEPPRLNLFANRPHALGESLAASLTYLHGLLYGTFPRLFPPGWTLEVEMQFYLLAPLFCLAVWRAGTRFGLGATTAFALGASGMLALAALASGIDNLHQSILPYAPLFLLGILAHAVRGSGWLPRSPVTAALGWPALAAFVLLQPFVDGQGSETALRMLLIALMFASLASGRGSFRAACTALILVQIGLVSYSAYLVHLQILHVTAAGVARTFGAMPLPSALLVNAAIGLPLTAMAALLMFRGIERPFQRISRSLHGQGAERLVRQD